MQIKGENDEDNLLHHPDVLAVKPLEIAQGYNLVEEDPDIYTDGKDVDNIVPRREWADKDLPTRTLQQASTEGPSKDDIVQSLPNAHHLHVDIPKSMGVNPSKDYE